MAQVVVKRFGRDGSVRAFDRGRFDVLELGGTTVGQASYEPGWRWSVDVGAAQGESLCQVEHVGLVLRGRAAVSFPDGSVHELSPGDLFHVPPGHDSWVVGDEPYVSLHLLGADHYAR